MTDTPTVQAQLASQDTTQSLQRIFTDHIVGQPAMGYTLLEGVVVAADNWRGSRTHGPAHSIVAASASLVTAAIDTITTCGTKSGRHRIGGSRIGPLGGSTTRQPVGHQLSNDHARRSGRSRVEPHIPAPMASLRPIHGLVSASHELRRSL